MFPPDIRFLVVDDNKPMRMLVISQFRSLGFKGEFIEAENGVEAFNLLVRQYESQAPVQFIVSDWNMPHSPGIDFLKSTRSVPHFKDIPFLMITAEADPIQVLEAAQEGVSNYILKPFSPATLAEKLLAVWRKHHPSP